MRPRTAKALEIVGKGLLVILFIPPLAVIASPFVAFALAVIGLVVAVASVGQFLQWLGITPQDVWFQSDPLGCVRRFERWRSGDQQTHLHGFHVGWMKANGRRCDGDECRWLNDELRRLGIRDVVDVEFSQPPRPIPPLAPPPKR